MEHDIVVPIQKNLKKQCCLMFCVSRTVFMIKASDAFVQSY